MGSYPLDGLITRFSNEQASRLFAAGARKRYGRYFVLFDRFSAAGLLDRTIDYPMPKIPKRIFRVWMDEEL